jgi:vancomycin resistance protein VanJ
MSVPFPFLPIDQLFAGPGWAMRSVERLPRTGSDHYPLRVRLVMQD